MSQQLSISLETRYGAHNYAPLPVVLSKGDGAWLWDTTGKKYLDFMSAYSAVSLGHGHPRILKALEDQAAKLSVVSRAFYSDILGAFLERLCQQSGMDMALPMNTGAEAVETAIKAARRWGYQIKGIPDNQAEIIVAADNFHGRTTTIISFSSEAEYQRGFGPYTPGFKIVPFGDLDAMEQAITANTAAVLIEPIQGEAGIVVPPAGYLKAIRRLCDDNNMLLILDEIQSGLCRTGKWFAHDHEDIKPDGMTLGKALGGGVLPVSAFLARREVMELFNPGSHGSTFGGNCLAAAVGLETLNVMRDENLAEHSAALGEHMMTRLRNMRSPLIRDVRGKGLWVGVVLDAERALTKNTGKNPGRALCEELMSLGVLTKETHDTVVRLAPPLVISQKDLDWGLDRFEDALSRLGRTAA